MHRQLLARGVHSEILGAPAGFDTRLHWKAPRRWFEAVCRRRDALIFQKVESSRAVRFARLVRSIGSRVIFVQADYRDSPLYAVSDRVVVPSVELARQLGNLCRAPMTVIEDPIDIPPDLQTVPSSRTSGLRLLWIGNGQNFPSLDALRSVLQQPRFGDMTLITVSDHPEASVPWSEVTAREQMLSADIGVIPCLDTPAARAKSNNRLTMLMAAGLPVIASPIPAYTAIIEPGSNGLLARTVDEWGTGLLALRQAAARRALGAEARRTAWQRFAPEVIASRWVMLLSELLGTGPAAAALETVSKSIPS